MSKAVKYNYQGREFRGEWSEDECRLSLMYEGPDGTVTGMTTIGGGGNLCVRAGSYSDNSIKIPVAERDQAAAKVVEGLCFWMLHDYKQKYGMIDKQEVCSSMSEWAGRNPD